MTDYETVGYDSADAVAVVTIRRPDAMNSFNTALRSELATALKHAADDASVRAVVLTGEGRAFSAGADLKEGIPEGDYTVEDQLQKEYRPSLDAINTMPKPVIAAINGSAAGIGLSFALACDLAIMAEGAFLLSPFTTISLVGDGGSNWLLARQLGYKRAFELSIMSERISAAQALDYGLVNRLAPAESLMDEARSWAAEIATRAPLSVAVTKKVMRFAMTADYDDTYDLEAREQVGLVGCEDNIEGVTAFFEKRAPNWKGR